MNDKDQKLLWEAYLEKHTPGHKKDEDVDKKKGKYDDGDGKEEKCDHVPCKEDVQEEDKTPYNGDEGDDGEEDEVQEEMDNLEFSAAGRENPEQMVFDAVLSWMRADTEGLTTPEDMEGYSMSTAFDDAKDFIKQALQDISFSEVKAHLNSTVDLGAGYDDPEEMAFQKSVDDDIKRDDSRLSDMPPREPGL